MTFKVYTKTGDEGTSSLYTGHRREKDDLVFEALGDNDELNSAIGLASAHCSAAGNGLCERLAEIQSRVLDVGSAIATPLGEASLYKVRAILLRRDSTKLACSAALPSSAGEARNVRRRCRTQAGGLDRRNG